MSGRRGMRDVQGTARRRLAGRRLVVVVVAAAVALPVAAGLGGASAARLDVRTGTVAAGTGVVASCQTSGAVRVGLDSTFRNGAYRTRAVVLRGVDAACAGLRAELTVTGSGGTESVVVPSVVRDPAGTVTIPVAERATSGIGSVAVVLRD